MGSGCSSDAARTVGGPVTAEPATKRGAPSKLVGTVCTVEVSSDTLSSEGVKGVPPHWKEDLVDEPGPVVAVDLEKGMAYLKKRFLPLFPRAKLLTFEQLQEEHAELIGASVILVHNMPPPQGVNEIHKALFLRHLEKGGGVICFGSGCCYMGFNLRCLQLVPFAAHDRRHWNRGTGKVSLVETQFGKKLFGSSSSSSSPDCFACPSGAESGFWHSPLVLPLGNGEYRRKGGPFDIEGGVALPILEYASEMNECGAEASLVGMPAVCLAELMPSKARVVSVGPHMEITPTPEGAAWLDAAACWASSGLKQAAGGEGKVVFLSRPVFSLESMTGTDRDGGRLRQLPCPSPSVLSELALGSDALQALNSATLEGGEETFRVPEGKRVVALDLGKGEETLTEMFGSVAPDSSQRTVMQPEQLKEEGSLKTGRDAVILHGGMANEHADKLFEVRGREALRDFVAAGGAVLGICAGAHWVSCRNLPGWGHIAPLVPHDNSNWRRGVGDVRVRLTEQGRQLVGDVGGLESDFTLRYANGPLNISLMEESFVNFQPGRPRRAREEKEEDDDNEEEGEGEGEKQQIELEGSGAIPLLLFAENQSGSSDNVQTDKMKGHCACWASVFKGGGRVIALSPHPEYAQTPVSRNFLRRLLMWLLG
uniref:Biotin-protein ligase N-terminal domain-containing protein n=1 Tax=Chromera velia CCMP2878 TaxID=1169474 RepID=A0A0G4I5X0_9ALVE|eukprot:Cvel_11219.t1-p1 / transcript=Cvel_11219.t1 / gene=Cvel_11219 / organism=Chromera_velia_CCMP2878 / gene_product=hypothetical protein / transcript_product=hypothetical protein / location=Cvel_scaffold698:9302-12291(+) / protein_length=651 / sequence_SO=supercontig / SO=protein_coding / is_pseudo=false